MVVLAAAPEGGLMLGQRPSTGFVHFGLEREHRRVGKRLKTPSLALHAPPPAGQTPPAFRRPCPPPSAGRLPLAPLSTYWAASSPKQTLAPGRSSIGRWPSPGPLPRSHQ